MTDYTKPFQEIHQSDLPFVGARNAFLGEIRRLLTPEGIHTAPGFAVTAYAYQHFIYANNLGPGLRNLMETLDGEGFTNLADVGREARKLIYGAAIPKDLESELLRVSAALSRSEPPAVFVWGSPVWEDNDHTLEVIPGQHAYGSYVMGYKFLPAIIKSCYAALFSDHAIRYREVSHIPHHEVSMPVGVQKAVRGERLLSVLSGSDGQCAPPKGRTLTDKDARLIQHCMKKIAKTLPQALQVDWIKEEGTDKLLLLQVGPQSVYISPAGFPENV